MDGCQKQRDHLESNELDKRLWRNLLRIKDHRRGLYHWIGNTGSCMGRAVRAARISTEYFALLVGNLATLLMLIFLVWLQKVRISFKNSFHI